MKKVRVEWIKQVFNAATGVTYFLDRKNKVIAEFYEYDGKAMMDYRALNNLKVAQYIAIGKKEKR